jgi:hypothetical protein
MVSNSLFETSKLTQERRAATQRILSDWMIRIHFPLLTILGPLINGLLGCSMAEEMVLMGEDRGHGIASISSTNPSSH